MGSSSETIRNLQVVGVMEKYGGLNKALFIGEAQQISSGMPVVRDQRQTDVITIKSMYNAGYLDAMGYEPVSKIKVKDINLVSLLQHTKTTINNGATKIVSASIRPLTIKDKVRAQIQFNTGYLNTPLSYLDGSTRIYYHTAIDVGNYLEITFYESVPLSTITDFLDNKYVDGITKISYEITSISDTAMLVLGVLKFKVDVKYKYKVITTVNGVNYEEIFTDTAEEYFTAPIRYDRLTDTDYDYLRTLAATFTKSISYYGCYEPPADSEGNTYRHCLTITGSQTATVKGIDDIELVFNISNPNNKGRWNTVYIGWENVQSTYQLSQLNALETQLNNSVRKLVWEYETATGQRFIAFQPVNSIPNIFKDTITEVYPIIPIKENLTMVKDTAQTKMVLSKIGMKRGDLIKSVEDSDIRSSFLVFGVLPNDSSPECAEYLFEYFNAIGNSSNTDYYGTGNKDVFVEVEYLYKSAAGIKQKYTLNFQIVHNNEEGSTPKRINSYWYQKYSYIYETYTTSYTDSETNETTTTVHNKTYNVNAYCKQISESAYVRILLLNVQASSTTSGYTFQTTLLTYEGGGEGSESYPVYHMKGDRWDIRIPIIRDITNIMRFDHLCHVIERSMALLIFTQVTVKVKWYQQPWVTMVLFAVAAWTGQYYVVAATTATTMATVVVVAGVAMAASTALIIGVTMLTLTMLSMMGVDLGVFGVIASIALVFMGGYAMLSSTNTLAIGMRQVVMLAAQTAKIASQVNSFFFNKNIKELAKEQARALAQQSEELDKYKKESEQLLENTIPGGINMFGSEIPDIDSYYMLAYDDYDQYELMYNFAVDYDSMFKTV